ncbi:MAG: hypothetical protein IT284_01340 [Bacteroidetes bacterium]|nr:hypothetical protein [Bacteroidota bacterium]
MLDLETKFAFAPIMAEGDEMGEENMDDTENMEGEEKKEEGEMNDMGEEMGGGMEETPE